MNASPNELEKRRREIVMGRCVLVREMGGEGPLKIPHFISLTATRGDQSEGGGK